VQRHAGAVLLAEKVTDGNETNARKFPCDDACAGFLWLGLFFYWGASWVKTPKSGNSRGYTFWLVISLLAAIHFALQLSAQILYMQEDYQRSPWLDVLGFPNRKKTFDKFLVRILNSSCCRRCVLSTCSRSTHKVSPKPTPAFLPREPKLVAP
jgi:hypothetical protein